MTNIDGSVESWIKRCLKLAESIDCDEVVTALTELDVRWQFPGFRLAFVGEFSRGKSTLINRLLERTLLPIGAKPTTGTLISVVAGSTEKMEVYIPDKGWTARPLEESSWNDLLSSEQGEDSQEQLTQVRLTIDHPWLRSIDVELIDTPGAGDLNSGRTVLLCELLSQCDAAVLLISATLPFSRTEATFLEQEVLGRHIPNVLVAVSKLDTVDHEQKAELLGVIRERVMEISREVPIVPIHPLDSHASEVDTLERVRTQIEAMVEKGERRIRRSKKVAGQLVDYLNHIAELSEAAIKTAHMNAMEKEQALHQLEKEKEEAEIYWEDIRLEIDERRLQHAQRLRQKVLLAKNEFIETYSFDLNKEKDLKTWSEHVLPSQIRRELLSLGNKWSEEILAELSLDFEWVYNEVNQKFSRQIVQRSSDLPTTVKPDFHLSQLQLTDNVQNYSFLTGLATTTNIISGLIVSGPSPVQLKAVAVVSRVAVTGVAWFVGNQLNHQKIEEQRRQLSQELIFNVNRITDDYCNQMSERLRELYSQLIEELRQEQRMWQSAWESTLKNSSDTQDTSHHSYLLEQVSALKEEIYLALSNQVL